MRTIDRCVIWHSYRRQVLRYRNLLVRQAVQMKNKVTGLLMEAGVPYNQQKVHQKKYFAELLQNGKDVVLAQPKRVP